MFFVVNPLVVFVYCQRIYQVFAPADDPQILGMCIIYNPQGVYYGGTIAAPVIGKIFENILPYLGIEKE